MTDALKSKGRNSMPKAPWQEWARVGREKEEQCCGAREPRKARSPERVGRGCRVWFYCAAPCEVCPLRQGKHTWRFLKLWTEQQMTICTDASDSLSRLLVIWEADCFMATWPDTTGFGGVSRWFCGLYAAPASWHPLWWFPCELAEVWVVGLKGGDRWGVGLHSPTLRSHLGSVRKIL